MVKASDKKILLYVATIDSCIATHVTAGVLGSEIFHHVCTSLGIYETQWFGLRYKDVLGNNQWFLDTDKLDIKKIKNSTDATAHLEFVVKCHPVCAKAELLQEPVKIYFFKTAITQMVLDPEFYVFPEEIVCAAVAYICLVRHENPSLSYETIMETRMDRLLTERIVARSNFTSDALKEVILSSLEIVKTLRFIEPLMQCLTLFEQNPLYGIVFFPIVNKKQTALLVGIESHGLNVYKGHDRNKPLISFSWKEIKHVAYEGKMFKVSLTDKSAQKLHLYSHAASQCQAMVLLVEWNHQNYIRRKTAPEKTISEIPPELLAVEMVKEKNFEEIKQSNFEYEATVEKVLETGIIDQTQSDEIEKKFMEAKMVVEKQIEETKHHIEEEKKTAPATEELKKIAVEMNQKLSEDEENKQKQMLFENSQKIQEEESQHQLELLNQRIKELELRHSEDLKKINEIAKSSAKVTDTAGKSESSKVPVKSEKIPETTQSQQNEFVQKIKKFSELAKTKEKQSDQMIRPAVSKYETIKAIRKNSARSRVDEFEAQI